jgi:hypothetical protein
VAGIDWLGARGLRAVAVSGVVARSPLACRELVAATGMPVCGPMELRNPDFLEGTLDDRVSLSV